MLKEDMIDPTNWQLEKAPPLGIKPRKLWLQERVAELIDALKRYRDAGQDLPYEWVDELASLINEIALMPKKIMTAIERKS